jgi:hypothetical protein
MVLQLTESAIYNRASEEFTAFEKYKQKKFLPILEKTDHGVLSSSVSGKKREIWVGPVSEWGKKLPLGKNLADYIDTRGRFQILVRFFLDHKKLFPNLCLWILAQKEASRRVVEVGCEQFFGLSGYISSARRSQLGVRHYERLSMLASIMQKVYIDTEWVAKEYLCRCKQNKWKEEEDSEALRCWNLERVIDAETYPIPDELTLSSIGEKEG